MGLNFCQGMPKTSVMKENICPDCGTQTLNDDGYCLTGHAVMDAPRARALSDLSEQVNAAFEEARVDLESTMWAGIDPVAPVDMLAPAPPPPPPAAPERTAPRPPTRVPPPPPPPKPQEAAPEIRPVGSPHSLWDNFTDQLEEGDAVLSSSDPIAAFSPAPRMDWGPAKSVAGMKMPFSKRRGDTGRAGPSIQPA